MKSIAETFWEEIIKSLPGKVNEFTMNGIVPQIKPAEVKENILFLSVCNRMVQSLAEERVKSAIEEILYENTKQEFQVCFQISEDGEENFLKEVSSNKTINLTGESDIVSRETNQEEFPKLLQIPKLNLKYTFETYIVGQSNAHAHAVMDAASREPGKKFNPIFLYGGVGLGKTHLMQALGHRVYLNNPNAKIVYIPSETFINDFIYHLKTKNMYSFRGKYRNADVLLIDDIQFLKGKENTQEEFHHTFNTLFQEGKQIVLSSDRPPQKLENMEDRLVTRFNQGVCVDIQPPNLELRMAILKNEAEAKNIKIDNELIEYIAQNVVSNIRELEGAFVTIIAYASMFKDNEITKAIIDRAIKENFKKPILTVETIQKEVCQYYNISMKDIQGTKRSGEIVKARQIAMYICRELLECSLNSIGEHFNKKDHTTVLHSIKKIESQKEKESSMDIEVNQLIEDIKTKHK